LDASCSAIRKDLAQYVRISSWKDVNPAALRASAQKTHRHLARCVRRWREALSQPMFQIVQAAQTAAVASPRVPVVQVVALPLQDAGLLVRLPPTLATLCSSGRLPWDSLGSLEPLEEHALAAAKLVVSPQIARVLELSPAHMQRLVRLMRSANVFGSADRPVDTLDEFAQQIVGDVSYFQAVETPKHLVKPSSRAAKKAPTGDPDEKKKKKNLIKSKKQREAEEEQEAYVEDDEERQRLIKRFWGEQRNLRRTRLKDILRALQDLGLKRAVSSAAGESSGDLASVLAQPPLDLSAWHQSTTTAAHVHSPMVHPLAPRTLNAWQLADASFFRLCATTGQLRAAAYAEHSAEVDAKQVLLILSLTQRLATHVAQDRTHAATLLQHAARWMQASVAWSSAVVSTEEQAGVVGLHELKRRVDCVLDLAMQMRGGVRAIAEAQGWRVEDAEQVAKAVQL
ncbi:AAA ATPase midasin, partial [Coemansia sp. RSA 2703]